MLPDTFEQYINVQTFCIGNCGNAAEGDLVMPSGVGLPICANCAADDKLVQELLDNDTAIC